MAAPAPTQRAIPSGVRLENGHHTLITFAADTDIDVFEKAVTPAGLDGGAPIETFDMFRRKWRTMAPRKLITMTPVTIVCNFDPKVFTQLLAIINIRTTITEMYPNGATLAYFGYLQKAEKNSHADGTQPEYTLTVIPTNEDPTAHTEEDPVFTPFTGTGDPFDFLDAP